MAHKTPKNLPNFGPFWTLVFYDTRKIITVFFTLYVFYLVLKSTHKVKNDTFGHMTHHLFVLVGFEMH